MSNDEKQYIAEAHCETRYGLRLRFNRGKVRDAKVVDSVRFAQSGRSYSWVINKYNRYLEAKDDAS